MIDIHSHILPGLDDGSQSLEESVQMAQSAVADGIKKMVATPHLYRNNFEHEDLGVLEQTKNSLVEALKANHIPLEIYLGAEVHISHNLFDEIRLNRKSLVINESSYILIEFPSDHIFSGVKHLFFDLMSDGLTPIIAHPERNSLFARNPELLYDLVHMGGFTQMNSGSFYGLYGRRVREVALQFLELNLLHFIGSDCHNVRFSRPRFSDAVKNIAALAGETTAAALVYENPQALLDDEDIPFRPEPINPREKHKSFKIKIPSFFSRK